MQKNADFPPDLFIYISAELSKANPITHMCPPTTVEPTDSRATFTQEFHLVPRSTFSSTSKDVLK